MSKFNWWRRYRPKNKLQRKNAKKGIPFLLQQIDHGDFDHSDFKRQAEEELVRCDKDLAAFTKAYKGNNPQNDERYLEIERRYRKRYNRLMEDYYNEESSRLMDLRSSLVREFGVDVWEETFAEAIKKDLPGAREFYFLYSELSEKQLESV